jgi:hypothetical protein
VDELVRLAPARLLRAVVAAIAEAENLAILAGRRDGGDRARVHRRPPPDERAHRRFEGVQAPAQPLRQQMLELGKRRDARRIHPSHTRRAGGPERDADRHRLGVVEQKGRECGPTPELVPPCGAGARVDRVAEIA